MILVDYAIISKLMVDEDPIVLNPYKYLNNDLYTLAMIEHIENQFDKQCSSKVKSHILMTQMIYLMETKAVFVDLENEKLFFNSLGIEYYIEYKNHENLYHMLYNFFVQLPPEIWEDYETYRSHTRQILDNLDNYENLPYSKIWTDLVLLSQTYFKEQSL